MDIGRLGVWTWTDGLPTGQVEAFARQVEGWGYSALWIPEAMGREPFALSGWLLGHTQQLIIATGIANIYARDPIATAQGQRTLAELSGGRFLLGIGVSHKPMVESVRGHDASKPLTYMRTYLDHMANAPWMAPSAAEEPPTVIAALHPKMLKLSAERTQGAHPYLVPPEHTAWAREQMGPDAWLCPEQKVILQTDATKAREVAREALGMYLTLPNYRRSLQRFGMTDDDLADGGSDKLVDAVVAWGDEDAIRERIKAHHDAGADHVCIQALHPDGLPIPDERILAALAPNG